MSKTISSNGLSLIKQYEGCKLTAYQDSAGVWTIGWGTTNADKSITGLTVKKGVTITQAQADSFFEKSVNNKYVPKVLKYDSTYGWNQNQLDALTSFAYNIGSIDGLTAKGTRSISEISGKITAYNKSGGKVLAGLTKRRAAEKTLFDTPVASSYTQAQFILDVQKALGFPSNQVDGKAAAGGYTIKHTITVSASVNNRHPVITPLERYLKELGYYSGNIEADIGKTPAFGNGMTKAVNTYQKSYGGKGTDGEITAGGTCWKHLLGIL